jgi:hypothetical protein
MDHRRYGDGAQCSRKSVGRGKLFCLSPSNGRMRRRCVSKHRLSARFVLWYELGSVVCEFGTDLLCRFAHYHSDSDRNANANCHKCNDRNGHADSNGQFHCHAAAHRIVLADTGSDSQSYRDSDRLRPGLLSERRDDSQPFVQHEIRRGLRGGRRKANRRWFKLS